jgi:hypothetical protein
MTALVTAPATRLVTTNRHNLVVQTLLCKG